ncbi:hypothetical protein ACU686_22315 [Yinghuangia aomiensis]
MILGVNEFGDQYRIEHAFIKRLHDRYRGRGHLHPAPRQTVSVEALEGVGPPPGARARPRVWRATDWTSAQAAPSAGSARSARPRGGGLLGAGKSSGGKAAPDRTTDRRRAAPHTNPSLAPASRTRTRSDPRGAGGGFDVYAGLPLRPLPHAPGRGRCTWRDLSFGSSLAGLPVGSWRPPTSPPSPRVPRPIETYFPELDPGPVAEDPRLSGLPSCAFPQIGVQPLRAAYRALIGPARHRRRRARRRGTDILMRGDEAGLGTPREDLTSVAALAALDDVPQRLVVSVGFGVDAYRKGRVTRRIAGEHRGAGARRRLPRRVFHTARHPGGAPCSWTRRGHTPGAHPGPPEHRERLDRRRRARAQPSATSEFTTRTSGSELFVNPLVSLCFALRPPGTGRAAASAWTASRTPT